MEEQTLESAILHGIRIRLSFTDEKPTFVDLFLIRGFPHPHFPPTGRFSFAALEHLGFDQVDDYFGIPAYEEDGDDVKVWLFPLIKGKSVYHHQGPFDGLELSYDALRNPPQNAELFLEVVSDFARHLPAQVHYSLRDLRLENPPDLTVVRNDIAHLVAYWREQNIEPGSNEALLVSF